MENKEPKKKLIWWQIAILIVLVFLAVNFILGSDDYKSCVNSCVTYLDSCSDNADSSSYSLCRDCYYDLKSCVLSCER